MHSRRHVAIERKVGAEDADAVILYESANLEIWVAHFDAKCLCFVAACHGASVVVAENYDRTSVEFGVEHSLARHEEIVAVGKGEHGYAFLMM